MKRIPLNQLRDILIEIQALDAQFLKRTKRSRNFNVTEARVWSSARHEFIEAINQAFDGDIALLQTYLPED